MIEIIMLKLCFDEGQLEQYLKENNQVATVIHASYDEAESNESDRQCYFCLLYTSDAADE